MVIQKGDSTHVVFQQDGIRVWVVVVLLLLLLMMMMPAMIIGKMITITACF
jgi:hypothetical protein